MEHIFIFKSIFILVVSFIVLKVLIFLVVDIKLLSIGEEVSKWNIVEVSGIGWDRHSFVNSL